MRHRTLFLLFLICALYLSVQLPAFAQTSATATATVEVQDPGFSIAVAQNMEFQDTVSGATTICTDVPSFTVVNLRNTVNSGWHVTMQCGNFTSGANNFSGNNLRYTCSQTNPQPGTLTSIPFKPLTNTIISTPIYANAPMGLGTTNSLLSAASSTGLPRNDIANGIFMYTPPTGYFSLVIPPGQTPGMYQADLTFTLVDGP